MTPAGPKCRLCGAARLTPVISLGAVPLANALLTQKEDAGQERRYALRVGFCEECALVQLLDDVPPDAMFRTYTYFSSVATTMVTHAERLASRMIRDRNLGAASFVLEVASNDGYLLQFYQRAGISVLGIDPAQNIAEVAEKERGIPTMVAYFDDALAKRLASEGRRADVIHAHNVLAHVPDPNTLAKGISALLKDDGIAVIEVPYVRELVEKTEFDTIYHEHYSYYSLHAIDRLASKNGLALRAVERIPIHGGSLRVFLGHPNGGTPAGIAQMLREEDKAGLASAAYYADFGRRVGALRERILAELGGLRRAGKSIAAYGASAKGTVLLNVLGLGPDDIDFVVDLNPVKQGRYMPGVHIPILPTEELARRRPDYTLLLVWNITDEVLAQQSAYRQAGGRFIVPIPDIRVI